MRATSAALLLKPSRPRDRPATEESMPSANLQLTIANDRFSITPLPAQVESHCTFGDACQRRATHRLLWTHAAGAELLCDTHAIAWAGDHGLHITTARFSDSAA